MLNVDTNDSENALRCGLLYTNMVFCTPKSFREEFLMDEEVCTQLQGSKSLSP